MPKERPAPRADPAHARCARCAYALAGLPLSGRCPECGLEVEVSLETDFLCSMLPHEARSLSRGLALLEAWAFSTALLSVCAGMIVVALRVSRLAVDASGHVNAALSIAACAAMTVGWWTLTPAERPWGQSVGRWQTATRALCVGAMLAVGAAGIASAYRLTLPSGVSVAFDVAGWVLRIGAAGAGLRAIRPLLRGATPRRIRASHRNLIAFTDVLAGLILVWVVLAIVAAAPAPAGAARIVIGAAGSISRIGQFALLGAWLIWLGLMFFFLDRARRLLRNAGARGERAGLPYDPA